MFKKPASFFNYQLSIILIGCIFIAFNSKAQYRLHIKYVDKDSSFKSQSLKLQTNFNSQVACVEYINKLPSQLNAEGFIAASIDSVWYDSTFATILLYYGIQQHWIGLNPGNIDRKALDESGFENKNFINKPINITQVKTIQQRLLNFYEKNGYPFAAISLDSISLKENGMQGIA
ncbi:MAG: hypothetical protein WDM71_04835 [Ferruginibacter sp.]